MGTMMESHNIRYENGEMEMTMQELYKRSGVSRLVACLSVSSCLDDAWQLLKPTVFWPPIL